MTVGTKELHTSTTHRSTRRGFMPVFCGGFVNFGHWQGIPLDRELSLTDRIDSHRALYRLVLRAIEVTESGRLLDIGCGRGHGAALAMREFMPAEAHGVDTRTTRIERARHENAGTARNYNGRLTYEVGSGKSLPYPDQYFDRVVSVQAVQEIADLSAIAAETSRAMRGGGRLAIASFFSTAPEPGLDDLPALSKLLADGLCYAHPVTALEDQLAANGFTGIKVASIGAHVWSGLDVWLAHTDLDQHLARTWLQAYRRGLLDYCVVTASMTEGRGE